jgi:hypothetical protein
MAGTGTATQSWCAAGLAIVNGGYKSFATEGGPPRVASPRLAWAKYRFMGDEHGGVEYDPSGGTLAVGDLVEFFPPHCDPTINLYDRYHCVRATRASISGRSMRADAERLAISNWDAPRNQQFCGIDEPVEARFGYIAALQRRFPSATGLGSRRYGRSPPTCHRRRRREGGDQHQRPTHKLRDPLPVWPHPLDEILLEVRRPGAQGVNRPHWRSAGRSWDKSPLARGLVARPHNRMLLLTQPSHAFCESLC